MSRITYAECLAILDNLPNRKQARRIAEYIDELRKGPDQAERHSLALEGFFVGEDLNDSKGKPIPRFTNFPQAYEALGGSPWYPLRSGIMTAERFRDLLAIEKALNEWAAALIIDAYRD